MPYNVAWELPITVVIPVYNSELFVADAIQSVLAQSYGQVECLVIDDGSTDSSADVAKDFGESVRVISTPNRGVAAARNLGISEASGDLIAFLDADDVWLPEKLVRQVELFSRHRELGLVYCGMKVVDQHLRVIRDMPAPPATMALRNTLLMEPPVVAIAQTGVVPASLFQLVGGFDEGLSTSADTDLVIRIAMRRPIRGIDEGLVLYRQHGNQMHLNFDAMQRDMIQILERAFIDPSLPPELARFRRRAHANLWVTIAIARLRASDWKGLVFLLRAMAVYPILFLRRLVSTFLEMSRHA